MILLNCVNWIALWYCSTTASDFTQTFECCDSHLHLPHKHSNAATVISKMSCYCSTTIDWFYTNIRMPRQIPSRCLVTVLQPVILHKHSNVATDTFKTSCNYSTVSDLHKHSNIATVTFKTSCNYFTVSDFTQASERRDSHLRLHRVSGKRGKLP